MNPTADIYDVDWPWLAPGRAGEVVRDVRAARAYQQRENRMRALVSRSESDENLFGFLLTVRQFNTRGRHVPRYTTGRPFSTDDRRKAKRGDYALAETIFPGFWQEFIAG